MVVIVAIAGGSILMDFGNALWIPTVVIFKTDRDLVKELKAYRII